MLGGFHDLLFEVSNENRYEILVSLRENGKRITDITREMDLTTPEARRHVSRLGEVGLIQRDVEGFYHLTPYGEIVLIQLREFDFMARHRDYLVSHVLTKIPTGFLKQIGELGESRETENVMDFLLQTENLFKESKEYVWLLVDQFPLNSLSTIIEAIERGVQFRIIESTDRIVNPNIGSMTSEEAKALSRTRHTPLVEQRMLDEVDVYQYLSEGRCVLAFPASDGQFDYMGFTVTDDSSLQWCRELFEYYWGKSEQRTPPAPGVHVRRGPISEHEEAPGQTVVVGRENPDVDAQAVQDAVDNFDVVILKGTFNFGSSSVEISRSVVVRGEGRENGIPSTTIFKEGWVFPFREWDYVFYVNGEGADVAIENLRFTDFNCTCIYVARGKSLNVRNNRITLGTGYGRGVTYGALGDFVIGIHVEPEDDSFKGGVTIDGNYVDFSSVFELWGGHISRGGLEDDPEYRPDLFNHEYYCGLGITVWDLPGLVKIENNVVRNANARGISVSNNLSSADVRIRHNTITSDVYGSYVFSSPESGAGVLAQSALTAPGPGFNVLIEDNTIKLDKLNYSGIVVLGPATDREGSDKLRGGIIRNNRIQLKDGYEGIHVRKCDDFEVVDNKISGEAYYGIRVSGRRKTGKLDLRALNNLVDSNNMSELRIREPNEYSDNHADGRRFACSPSGSTTAHVWLDKFSENNSIKIKKDETLIDEGMDNRIKRTNP